MSNPTTFERLREIIEIDFLLEAEKESDLVSDLGMDMTEVFSLVDTCEEVFGVSLPLDISNVDTVSDLVHLIDSKLSEAKEEEGAI